MTFPVSWFPALAERLAGDLAEGRVRKIRSPRPHEIVLDVRVRDETRQVLLSAHPRFPRAHRVSSVPPSPEAPSDFAMSLRKHAEGARVESVRAVAGERILEFQLAAAEGALRLVAECIPGKPDLVLVGPGGRILAVLRALKGPGRPLLPGLEYLPPPLPEGGRGGAEEASLPPGFPEGLEEEFRAKEEAFDRERTAQAVGRFLRRLAHKEEKRILSLRQDRAKAGDPEEWRTRGELLKIHAGRVEKGVREVEVPNLFEPGSPPLLIPLDPRLDFQGNMEACFRRYRKAKNGQRKIETLVAEAEGRIRKCEEAAARLEEAVAAGDSEALRSLAAELGLPPPGELPSAAAPGKGGKAEPKLPYRRFVSAEGLEIWVGRDARENDRLTRSDARGEDLWMHVAGYAGSHVVVKVPKGKEPSRETVLDAASLAAFFSQGRGKPVEVSYTQAKHVRKPRGAKPGLVMMAKATRLRVVRDEARLTRLLGKKPAER